MIPKIVHFLWMSPEKDEKTLQCLFSWKKHLDGYEIKEWNSETFPYKEFVWTKEAAEAKKWAFVTDYFRLWVLYNYGGIYMDADVLLQKNFDGLLDCNLFAGTEFTQQIGAHCMGSVAGHPYIKRCLDFYGNRSFKMVVDNGALQGYAIPRIMTYILARDYNVKTIRNFSDKPLIIADDIRIYSDNLFTIDIGDNKNIGIHLGLGSWRDSTTFANPIYMENLEWYFIKRYYQNDMAKMFSNKLKHLLYMIVPNFLIVLYYRYKSQIKNISTIMNVKNLITNHDH